MVKDKNIPPATLEELQKAIKSINKGKSADIYGITVEHILHAGKNLEMLLLNLINIIFKEGKVPDMLKEGLLTPVFKNKGEKNMATNYRGITVLPVLNKVIETIVKLRINPAVLITQKCNSTRIYAGSGPANAALPVELEKFQKKMLKQLMSLPTNTPDPAVNILTGILPVETQIHLKVMTLFINVCTQPNESLENN
ncbi:Hypothetical predicted protein [Mytilus galloprovincialis]|uniref:Reverse transcriptase domain-containing protein n=1 Tax=Mytilus galloprovincialis TaxID=29158 RepID=A0A8B6FKK9_MYTGA|nr:Hypothetical predicted protein [Mytilus galloprovincialis]